ncbi:hypothetical protein K435DRAFT_806814, partial [Dendrothele bispora CBS 962.96]
RPCNLHLVYLYTPDRSVGVNDWKESDDILKLQVMSTTAPNSGYPRLRLVLVISGKISSNDKPEPNLEILPKPVGVDTVVNLDWLLRTDPNNLYPFVTALPSGNVFVDMHCYTLSFVGTYYNEARILNPTAFDTIKTMPNMPDNVNNLEDLLQDPIRFPSVLGNYLSSGDGRTWTVDREEKEMRRRYCVERMTNRGRWGTELEREIPIRTFSRYLKSQTDTYSFPANIPNLQANVWTVGLG